MRVGVQVPIWVDVHERVGFCTCVGGGTHKRIISHSVPFIKPAGGMERQLLRGLSGTGFESSARVCQ